MAYEDIVINRLMRALDEKGAGARPEGVSPCSDTSEDDIRLLESWLSLESPHPRTKRKLWRIFGTRH
ncbi:hypothetical protein HQ346_22180 [Rhodococcus sp. BP-252]|uniref:hypothetical protein n=1 Tax=unclassified Rhodococcus (in: high G+C Gram-positive bacteria) TaxID=192944 RepID=UPI001C9AC9E5|nr:MULTISPECIES: hypothetical protein [unclassified Rhodococcus (in: high G+C Gram-positive bacteria)]MBY6414416.1 hypothetical protein [Rhodococcus sp. BP-320]MBY6419775.1 hypothetical protein [Rhodococcus sp. BP-321]MBY6424732.1 hypothetical protein [Rhodococcus sp. BP-324]MBY6429217.1 hypothetical protein [Rhodococcus sp. BP-323]MBY6434176.1 hypothetical protein [Rhodococcus sp. BP-322]